jgi:hypothetical protein
VRHLFPSFPLLIDIPFRHARSPMTMAVKSISTVRPLRFTLKYLSYISIGANLNAQIGLTNPATCGGDVCHMNLHKTFAMCVETSVIVIFC